ncbi:dimethylarginine dimethylaminohydrolase family protein [Halobacillus seohaensis]|uniref:Dimethylarginine dimethylaminohydrolase family protein n=1 Tax=Halobacillus seohaensis TaxID=447421 RepID=A0ABW2EMV8_9BACI
MQTKNAHSNKSKGCRTEYDTLTNVLVSKPEHMKIIEVINETQKHYSKDNIDIERAMEQHKQFTSILRDHHVEVEYLPTEEELNEQVFTRDIAFRIGDTMFVSSLASKLRQGETKPLLDYLEAENIPFTRLNGPPIEGGDVIVDKDTVFIGISNRTKPAAMDYLQQALPDYTLIPLKIRKDILHLDCAFNIVGEHTALIYSAAFEQQDADRLKQMYDCIEVSDQEQFHLGTNVLSIGERKVICLPQNEQTNQKLQEAGFEIIEVDLSEIIKSGGAFRCCSMPISRN